MGVALHYFFGAPPFFMERYMNILLAQMPIADAQVEINLSNVLSIIRNASPSTDLIVFPETTLSGFPTSSEIKSVGLTLRSKPIRLIQEAARKHSVGVAFGFCEVSDGRAYNTAVLVDDAGRIALKYRKTTFGPARITVSSTLDLSTLCAT